MSKLLLTEGPDNLDTSACTINFVDDRITLLSTTDPGKLSKILEYTYLWLKEYFVSNYMVTRELVRYTQFCSVPMFTTMVVVALL